MDPYSYTLTGNSLVVVNKGDGQTYTVTDTAPNYAPLKAAIEARDWDAVARNLEVRKFIEAWSKGNFKFDGNGILYKGEAIPGKLGERINAMACKGDPVDSLLKFWELLKKNPSMRTVEGLYDFLQHKGIPIGPNGHFRAYKGINTNFTDKYSGKVDNKPGMVNEMDRNKVSDDPRTPCYYGYHVGAKAYAQSFGALTVICEVSPEDVVCIPYDSDHQKMRVCRYKVIGLDNGDLMDSTSYDLEPELGTGAEIQPVGDEEDLEVVHGTPQSVEEASKKPVEKRMKKARNRGEKVTIKVLKKYRSIHEKNFRELMDESVADLREYATKVLSIVGASKIVGGKTALVKEITSTRKHFNFI